MAENLRQPKVVPLRKPYETTVLGGGFKELVTVTVVGKIWYPGGKWEGRYARLVARFPDGELRELAT